MRADTIHTAAITLMALLGEVRACSGNMMATNRPMLMTVRVSTLAMRAVAGEGEERLGEDGDFAAPLAVCWSRILSPED